MKPTKPVYQGQDFEFLQGHRVPDIYFAVLLGSNIAVFNFLENDRISAAEMKSSKLYGPYFDPFRSLCLADSTIDISFPVQTGTRLFKQIHFFFQKSVCKTVFLKTPFRLMEIAHS